MLVLSRFVNQRVTIQIPGRVPITVMVIADGRGTAGRVQLGFDAPPEVAIDREELAFQKVATEAVDADRRNVQSERGTAR